MRRTVVLQHDLPTGTSHLDWLIQTFEDPQARVMAFRVAARPDTSTLLVFTGERIADHRAFYLDHQGPVSGNRGTVSRLATGFVRTVQADAQKLSIEAAFGEAVVRIQGHHAGSGVWLFERL